MALLAVTAVPARQKHDLVILHVNDTHSHLDPERNGSGGVIERAAFADSVRKAEGRRNVLLLHAGDFEQGTPYFTLLKGDLECNLLNAMEYDCVTLGNHEFDNGIEELGRRLALIKCPIVCANYDFSPFEMGKYIKPWTIVRKAGMKIGIIGILCNLDGMVSKETSSRIPQLDAVKVVNQHAAYLKDIERCDLVILLSHAGYTGYEGDETLNDRALVPQISNVDCIVGGHSHTKLREPGFVNDATGRPVPIVQDWCFGREVGKIVFSK